MSAREKENAPGPWYKRSFGALYPFFYAHRSEQAAACELSTLIPLLELAPGAQVLDLCCGTGRHLSELIKQGFSAFGLDYSLPLLTTGAENPSVKPRIIQGDMRTLPFSACFDCVLNLFTSFGYFADDRENRDALSEMARVLLPGGVVVIDHINRRYLEDHFVPESEDRFDNGTLKQTRRIENGRVKKDSIWTDNNGGKESFTEDVRLYTPEALKSMLTLCGLTPLHTWGSFAGEPLTSSSERMLVSAKKP